VEQSRNFDAVAGGQKQAHGRPLGMFCTSLQIYGIPEGAMKICLPYDRSAQGKIPPVWSETVSLYLDELNSHDFSARTPN